MRWKLTVRYLLSILSIVLVVIFVNLAVLIGLLYFQQNHVNDNISAQTGETFTRQFQQYLSLEDEQPYISEDGVDALQQFGGWLQILDSNGNVVTSALSPEDAPTHYTPVELVHTYKYMDDDLTTHYIGEFEGYSYLLGVKDSSEERYVIMFNAESYITYISKAILGMTMADLFIALLIGLVFSFIITKPVSAIIERISQLKARDFSVQKTKGQGIFKSVFSNLNSVSKSLQAQEEERKKLEKMREEWISNVSHDLKTPLASIQGFAELLSEEEITESEREEYAKVIEQKSIYMKELLDDFNLTMRLRNEAMPLQLENTPLESFVREIVIDLLNDSVQTNDNLSFESNATDVTWNIDRHLMKRAISNFINNAVIHNDDETEIIVRVNATSIIIEDNGKGIAAKDVEQIFNRYYRGSNTENIQGTGLGLAISKDIIEAHGGTVTLTSEVGKGTKITVHLN